MTWQPSQHGSTYWCQVHMTSVCCLKLYCLDIRCYQVWDIAHMQEMKFTPYIKSPISPYTSTSWHGNNWQHGSMKAHQRVRSTWNLSAVSNYMAQILHISALTTPLKAVKHNHTQAWLMCLVQYSPVRRLSIKVKLIETCRNVIQATILSHLELELYHTVRPIFSWNRVAHQTEVMCFLYIVSYKNTICSLGRVELCNRFRRRCSLPCLRWVHSASTDIMCSYQH